MSGLKKCHFDQAVGRLQDNMVRFAQLSREAAAKFANQDGKSNSGSLLASIQKELDGVSFSQMAMDFAEDECHHMLGDCGGVDPRGIADLHATPHAGVQIHVVIARACLDELQSRGLFQKRGVDPDVLGDQDVRVRQFSLDSLRRNDTDLPIVGEALFYGFFRGLGISAR